MKPAILCAIVLLVLPGVALAGPVPPFVTLFMRGLLDDATAAEGRTTLEIVLTEFSPLMLAERSSDPDPPAEGKMILWMSDGTGFGDDGDLIIAATAGGVTKRAILWDFSAAATWVDYLLIEGGDYLLIEGGDKLILE